MNGIFKHVWLMAVIVLVVGWGAVAQDGIDEDSLLAMEDLTLSDAVEGDLPVAESGDDDLLAELLAGGDDSELEAVPATEALPEALPDEAFGLDEPMADEPDFVIEELPAEDLASTIEGIDAAPAAFEVEASALFEVLPAEDLVSTNEDVDAAPAAFEFDDTGDALAAREVGMDVAPLPPGETISDDLDLGAAIEELGLPAAEPEVSVDATPLAESVDVAMPPVETDSLDDLLGELAGEELTADMPLEEEVDLLSDLDGDMPAVVDLPIEEKGLDGTLDDLADAPEPDLDLNFLAGDLELTDDVVESPVVIEMPEVVEQPTTPETLVEIVEEPKQEAYVDDMALDKDLFEDLVNEAEGDVAAGDAALTEDAGGVRRDPALDMSPPSSVIEDLAADAEANLGLPVQTMPGPPSFMDMPDTDAVPAEVKVVKPRSPAPVRLTGKAANVAAFDMAERLKRIAGEAHGVESLQNAEKALAGRNYLRAIGLFDEAIEYLPRRPEFDEMRTRAREGLGGSYYLRALSLERMNELESAVAAARNSVKYDYSRGESAVKRIQSKIDAPPPEPEPEPINRWDMPEFTQTQDQIAEWLRRGRQAYLTGEYDGAILAFESVLARDPENKEAIRLMRSAAQKQYDRSSAELDATRTRMISAVRDTWNPRQYGLHEAPTDSKINVETKTSKANVDRERIIQKMTQIRIPEVDFRQANIRDVVDFLHSQSVEFDPSENPDARKGVNIILKLDETSGGGATEDLAPLDPFAAPSDAFGGGAGAGGDETLVTFSALDITLKEALDIVVDVSGLKYRIRGSVVIILPKNAAEGEIEHRMYDVLSTAITRLQDLSRAVSSDNNRGSGEFQALESDGSGAGEEVDLKSFFTEMGVEWPDRSSIKFVRGIGKLVVANTLENLTVFEKVLSILNVVPYQIEIEARFVEVAQTDVDSLGLEWLLNDNWELLQNTGASSSSSLAGRQRIVMNANNSAGGFTQGNRFLSSTGVGANTIPDSILSLSGVLTNPEMTVVLHALQQRGHTDLLSAPKITTQSGQQATIKVVTEYIYPTEFETSGISSGNDNGNNNNGGANQVGAVVTPSSFETREVGVILEVMPEVSPEGQMINLTLSPEVVSEPTWKNYGSSYTSYDPNGNPVVQELNMEQPFFHTRHLRTNLLIYNGATVVMGGMITEVRVDVDDKIPILGDIPILGRLFRSRYESSEKRNLLIFVTARLVDPSGRPLDSSKFGVDKSIAEKIVGNTGDGNAE